MPEMPNYDTFIAAIKQRETSDPAHRALMKKMRERTRGLNYAIERNGPSLFCDVYLRNFLREFNSRIYRGKGNEQPTSFNVLRSFVEPDEIAMSLNLLEERFYQFNLFDYIDFVTGPTVSSTAQEADFEELVIYELNSLGAFSSVSLPGFESLIFCGAALVREGNEISILGIFGNDVENFEPMDQIDPASIPAQRRELLKEGAQDHSAELLFDSDKFYPLLVMSRIDLSSHTTQVRYLLHESKDAFRVITDDPTIWDQHFKPPPTNITYSLKELSKHQHLFDFLNSMLQFPSFYQKEEDGFYVERHPTALKMSGGATEIRKLKSSLETHFWLNYRDVLTLPPRLETAKNLEVPRPDFKIETRGYWKTLAMGAVGADRNGNPVHGKTWVVEHLSWREATASEVTPSATFTVNQDQTEEVGFVYVMRSAMHGKNIFKIGFTLHDPEDRAASLSSTSGQPDALFVVVTWKVRAPRAIEKSVHRELGQYRLNDRREFFHLKLEAIRKKIDEIVDRSNARVH